MSLYINIPAAGGQDTWVTAQKALIQAYAPACNTFAEIKMGLLNLGGTLAAAATQEANMVGGGESNAAGTYRAFAASIYQTPKTTSWGIVFRGSMPTPVAGKFNSFGVANGAGTHDVAIASYFTVDASNYVLNIDGAASTTVASTTAVVATVADYAITFDATTIRIFKDGVQLTTTTTLTNVSDEPMFPTIFATDVTTVKVARIYYGYIGP